MKLKLIVSAAAVLALSGCGSSGLLDRERPDEFAVTRGVPLAIPADFSLPAPQAGAAPAQQADTKQQMLDAMFGTATPK